MVTTGILVFFMIMIHLLKKDGIRILKKGKVHAIFIVMAIKILFWLSVIMVSYIWIPEYLYIVMPLSYLLFLIYLFMEMRLFFQPFKTIKSRRRMSQKQKPNAAISRTGVSAKSQ